MRASFGSETNRERRDGQPPETWEGIPEASRSLSSTSLQRRQALIDGSPADLLRTRSIRGPAPRRRQAGQSSAAQTSAPLASTGLAPALRVERAAVSSHPGEGTVHGRNRRIVSALAESFRASDDGPATGHADPRRPGGVRGRVCSAAGLCASRSHPPARAGAVGDRASGASTKCGLSFPRRLCISAASPRRAPVGRLGSRPSSGEDDRAASDRVRRDVRGRRRDRGSLLALAFMPGFLALLRVWRRNSWLSRGFQRPRAVEFASTRR